MRCARCRGLMVWDHFYDLLDDSGNLRISGRRCVNCGNILDSLILQNKARRFPHVARI